MWSTKIPTFLLKEPPGGFQLGSMLFGRPQAVETIPKIQPPPPPQNKKKQVKNGSKFPTFLMGVSLKLS